MFIACAGIDTRSGREGPFNRATGKIIMFWPRDDKRRTLKAQRPQQQKGGFGSSVLFLSIRSSLESFSETARIAERISSFFLQSISPTIVKKSGFWQAFAVPRCNRITKIKDLYRGRHGLNRSCRYRAQNQVIRSGSSVLDGHHRPPIAL